jgi:hypothetical protein
MRKEFRLSSTLALSACCALATWCAEPKPQRDTKEPQIRIEVRDGQGARVAGADSARATSATLVYEREYQPGDRILIRGAGQIAVRLNEAMPECRIDLPDRPDGEFSFEIPFGHGEKESGSGYAPEAFAGTRHRVVVRALRARELAVYRNVALNPCDQRQSDDARVPGQKRSPAFPHASSNSVTRDWPDFEERNAIDGVTENGHHGIWPYQSWGPERRDDLWWKIDFGRPVEVDKIRLMNRADFPHDSYWKSAIVEFSDGGRLPIQIGPSAAFQEFRFPTRRVTWMRLTRLVAADPAKYASFVEIEVWGRDSR